jgi:diacylglycerol kinase (ATP)
MSKFIGHITVNQDTDLADFRASVGKLFEEITSEKLTKSAHIAAVQQQPQQSTCLLPSANWSFINSATAERFFRIDQAQEHLHYATDIFSEDLFIVYPTVSSLHPDLERRWSHQDDRTSTAVPEDIIRRMTISDESVIHRQLHRVNAKRKIAPDITKLTVTDVVDSAGSVGKSRQTLTEELFSACQSGNIRKVTESVLGGADVLYSDASSGLTALHYAVLNGHFAVVEYLVKHAAPFQLLDIVDSDTGQTALHKAAEQKHREICYLLVSAGASLTITDFKGNTASELALKAGDELLGNNLKQQSASCSETAPKLVLETNL